MKRVITIIIAIIMFLSCMLVDVTDEQTRGVVYAAPASTTTYADWSSIKTLDVDYSYSTMFYNKNTEIKVLKKGRTDVEWTTENNITYPKVVLHEGEEAILLITNCAVDKNGQNLDVVIKINNVHEWGTVENEHVYITFLGQELYNSQTNVAVPEPWYDYRRDIAPGELITFDLEARYSDCNFAMTYYTSGSYQYNANNNAESGVLGEITSINNFVYDIDIPNNIDQNTDRLFKGNEGLRTLTGTSTIYYNKNGYSIEPYNASLQELDGGIAVKTHPGIAVNGMWYKTSAFITTSDIRNSTYNFQYGGSDCGIGYSFVSPYPYKIEKISKSVSKTKVKEEENFTYTISQYIPNNYYGSLINFSEVYSNLYSDTHYSKVEISDNLDNNLVMNGNIYITNENRENKTNYFDVVVSGNLVKATAKSNVLGQGDFYAHVYNINVPVKIKGGTGPKLTDRSTITNKSNLLFTFGGDNTSLVSNTVSTGIYYDVTTRITNGTITESSSVDIHNNKTIEFRPKEGYYVSSVIINGEEQNVTDCRDGGTINISNITKDYDIIVNTEAFGYIQVAKKDSITKKGLAGAKINIYQDITCQNLVETLITGSNGTVRSRILQPNMTYYVKEVEAPENYVIDNIVHRAIVTPGNIAAVEILNEPYGQVQITKRNAVTNDPVAGAVIGIYYDRDCNNVVEGLERLTTEGTGGTIISKKIPAGTYYAKEIQAPNNYTLNEDIQTIVVQPAETTQVTFINAPYGDIQVVKKDSVSGKELSGVKINIYRDNTCQDLVQTLTTGTDGRAKSNLIYPNMTYYVKEIEAPANYVMDKTVHQANVTPGNTTTVEILNEPYGQVQITKKNAVTTNPVAGAVIGIYYDRDCNNVVEGLERLTTEGTGGTITSKKIPAGTYYAKELQPPTNYTLNEDIQTIVVKPAETAQVTFMNDPYGYIQVTKKDSNTKEVLQGAKIGIYTDSACQELVQVLTTGIDGTAKSNLIYPNMTYYLKEIEAPSNYVLNSTVQTSYVYPGQTTQALVEDKPNTAQVEIFKIDNHTGKIVTKEDTIFALYEWQEATSTWGSPTHIKASTIKGTVSDGKGAILTEKKAGTKGTYTATMYYNALNQGKFRVVEYTRPYGYTTSNWVTEFQITQDGQVFSYHSEVRNTQVRGQINFKKNDTEVNYNNEAYVEGFSQGDASLQGAIYGVYAKEDIVSPDDGSVLYQAGQQVTTGTTDANGKITWTNLTLGKYNIREITPSIGYLKDNTDYEVDLQTYYYNNYFSKGDQTTSNVVYKNTVADSQDSNLEQRVISKETIMKQSFQLTKLSLSEDSTMANPLQGAGFKIYLIKDLSKVKEGTIRADANGNYNVEQLKTIDFTSEQTALSFTNNINGERIPELFTNESGILVSPELAYGKYIIIESTVPEGVQTIVPFIVDIQEDSRKPKNMVYPIDRDFDARVKIVKKDDTTGKTVLKANASYRIWDKTNNEYVEQWVAYPNKVQYGTEKNPYATTEEGYLLTPEVLKAGEYELIEVAAPEGYVIAGNEEKPRTNIKFTISTNAVYEVDPDLGAKSTIIAVEQQNSPQVGTITVLKQGEFLSNSKEQEERYQFEYSQRPVTDAKFAIYAKEAVYTQDNQGDKIYEKDQLIKEVETKEEGKAIFEKLPLGKYYIKEIKAGKGFTLNTEQKEVELTYRGQEQPVIYQDLEYMNERQKIGITITKKDREKGTVLQGAEFGLYTKEEISYVDNSGNNQTILANKLVAKATSGENGIATFNDENLPLGKYYIKELTAPKGYATNPERMDIDATYREQDVIKIEKDIEFTNIMTKLKIKITDYETGVDLTTTKIALKDEEDNIVGTYTIDDNGEIEVEGLEPEKQYKIEEIEQRNGYVKDLLFTNDTEDPNELVKGKEPNGIVTFTIQDSEQTQKVTLSNLAHVGKLEIEKTGEVLVGTEPDENGNMVFRYENKRIDTATFEVYAKEDIVHPDGKQGVVVPAGTKIAEGQTQDGILTITKLQDNLIQAKPEIVKLLLNRGLPLGIYEMKETKAPEGFVLNAERKEVSLTDEGQTQVLISQSIGCANERQKIGITITKKDREKGTILEGAEFGLYTKEAISYIDNSGNNQTILADQLLEKAISGENGAVAFNGENLPLGKYYIKELTAPKGYATNPEIIDIDGTYAGQEVDKIEKQVDFTNIMTKLKIRIVDDETDVDLADTQLVLKDEEGNVIGTYTIDDSGEIEVKGLEKGKQYKIEEIEQRYGYVKDLLFKNEEDPNELTKEKDSNGVVSFTIQDREEPEKVTLGNKAKIGQLEIEKTGEVLVGTKKNENGNIVFNYETQRIDTATFEIYAKEDIIHPDGKQGMIVVAGTKIGEGQTQNGILTITKFQDELIQNKPEIVQLLLTRGLPLGTYEIKETVAPKGYYYKADEQIKTVIIEPCDDNTEIENVATSINNLRQSTNIGKPNPGISVEKKAEKQTYKEGEQVVYTITVSNMGNTILKGIEVKETMINGEFDDIEGTTKKDHNTMVIEKLEKGEVRTLTYRYNIPEKTKGVLNNKVTAIGTPVKIVTTQDGEEIEELLEPVIDDAEEKVWIGTLIEKSADKRTYQPGDKITYTLNIVNPYDEAIENAIIADEKVMDGSILSTSKEGVTTAGNGVIAIGTIQARERIEIVYQYQIPKDYIEDTIANTAKINGIINKEPITPEESTTTIEVKKSGIEVTKEAEKENYQKGEVVNYSIKVTNIGTTVLKNVTIQETLLNGKFEEKMGMQRIDDKTVKIDQLKVGQSITLTYQYTVGNERIIGEKIQNKVIATGKGTIENPDDPNNPTIEEVTDEAEKEIVVKDNDPANTQLGVYKTDVETGETITGVVFGLYTAEDIIGLEDTILIAKDTLIEKATTNQNGYATFTADLPIGKFYILEMKPATGYIENTRKLEIDSTQIGSSEKEYMVKMEIQNKKTEINIEKIEKTEELEQRTQITGAKLQILEEEENVVEEWITDENPHNIKGLETQKEYTLHEAEPAKGYVTTEDIKFSINLDGSLAIEENYTVEGTDIPTIIMQDDITKIKIMIVDKETKEPIKDVVVEIVDKETGEVVYEFTTDGEEQIIEKIPIGDYEIREKDFPRDQGYVSIETEEFTVEDTPEIQEKVIEQDYTKLDVSFLDEITKDLLPGGKLEIRNEDDEVVATIDDTGVHGYVERLPAGDYTIVEVETPEGYEPIQDVKFTLEDTPEIQYVVIENRRLPFDLQVEKYASEVLVNGVRQAGVNQVGQIVKIEIDGKKIAKQNVEIVYTIKVTNTGKVEGSVGEVIDKIPLGLTFDASKNEAYWKSVGNTIMTTAFANTKIKPNESIELKMVLDWTKSEFNLGEKENVVMMGGFSNNPGFKDEDESNNTSSATILLSVKTGIEIVYTKQIIAVVVLELAMIGIIIAVEVAIMNKKNRKYNH